MVVRRVIERSPERIRRIVSGLCRRKRGNVYNYKDCVIVSRHHDTVMWLRSQIITGFIVRSCDVDFIKHIKQATAEDVKGKVVFGNLPMHLACHAAKVYAVEFDNPPRGQEYGRAEMAAAGIRMVAYTVAKSGEGDALAKAKDVKGVVDCTGDEPVVRPVAGKLDLTLDGCVVGHDARLYVGREGDVWDMQANMGAVGYAQPTRPRFVDFCQRAVAVSKCRSRE